MSQFDAASPLQQDLPLEFRPLHDELRDSPRVVIDLPARLQLDEESPLQVTVHDVSPDSMQVRCSAADALRLLPACHHGNVLVSIWLHLPFSVGALNLKADCMVTHATEHDDGTLALGL